ncbi:hypothetical protein ACFS4T_23090 [Pseudomonas lini]
MSIKAKVRMAAFFSCGAPNQVLLAAKKTGGYFIMTGCYTEALKLIYNSLRLFNVVAGEPE